jgi:RNA polymerase subunit RPABC4/transcription elongation factor Spt4/uncharacterized membrane protein YgdD (TMEM256/DUF423 family)
MNLRAVASLLLLVSLAIPWTVTWGTNEFVAATSSFYILEFPFMAYYVVTAGPQETWSWWEPYKSVPKYFGTVLILLGTILSLWGSAKKKQGNLVEWGGIFSLIGSVIFSGSAYQEISIEYPLFQSYTSLPIGMFIPVAFWFLILIYPEKPGRYVTEIPFEKSGFFCGECGREISLEFEFCPFCGNKTERITCKKCGVNISVHHTFCPHCGSRIQREPEKALII